MSVVEGRLAEAGLAVPEVAPPLAAYVPAARTGSLVFTAGQLPLVGGELRVTGKLGGGVDIDTAHAQAQICALNALGAIKALIGDLDQVVRVVKVVVFVASDPSFASQPQVANGASELLQLAFGESGVHARSAVGVAVLPRDACVEVEVIAEVAPSS